MILFFEKIEKWLIETTRQWFFKKTDTDLLTGSIKGEWATAGLLRRTIIKGIGIFGVWTAFLLAVPGRIFSEEPQHNGNKNGSGGKEHLPKWGMAIDLDKCTGCGACVVACAQENNTPFTGTDPKLNGTQIYWMNLLTRQNERQGEMEIVPDPCMHCEDPPCVKVCPVGATMITEEGIVAQIYDRCIGCRYCMEACPYSRRYFNWTKPEWPDTYKNFLNPDVSPRPRGIVEKCTFCSHRIRRVSEEARIKGTPATDKDLQNLTACSAACPANAIVFGNLNDPKSRLSRLSKSPRVFRLLEHLGTKPKVFYLAKERRTE